MAVQVRGTFSALYDNVDKAIELVLKTTLKEYKPIWRTYYDIKKSSRKFERIQTVTPFGNVPQKDEGNPYAFDLIRPGWSVDFTHTEFGMGFMATETALEDDEFDVLMKNAEMLAFSARYTQELQAAAPLNNGFTTQNTPDGVTWFSTAHVLKGGGTAANRESSDADLSVTALKAALARMRTDSKVESGQILQPATALHLVVAPNYEFLAHQLVKSAGLPQTNDNDTNSIKDLRDINIVVNPLLTEADGDAWYLLAQNKSMIGLRAYERVPITLVPQQVAYDTGNKVYKIRFRTSWGLWTFVGSWGSAGA